MNRTLSAIRARSIAAAGAAAAAAAGAADGEVTPVVGAIARQRGGGEQPNRLRSRTSRFWWGVRRSRRDQSGAAAVEFALILTPFLLLIFGMIQYGLYFYASQTGSHAANTAVRQLSVGKCTDPAELLAFVENQLGASNVDGTTTVDTAYVNSDGTVPADPQSQNVVVGGQVTLRVTFDSIDLNFPLLPFLNDGEVTRTVDARVEFVGTPGCAA